jgi:hypothetical protein
MGAGEPVSAADLTEYYGLVLDGKRLGHDRIGLFATEAEIRQVAAEMYGDYDVTFLHLLVNEEGDVVQAAELP